MSKNARLNELLMSELALIVNREIDLPGTLITISYVECSPDLKQAKVGFSVLPENLAGTALRKLKSGSGLLIDRLRHRLPLRRFPHLQWEFDATEKEAGKIEQLIAGFDDEDSEE